MTRRLFNMGHPKANFTPTLSINIKLRPFHDYSTLCSRFIPTTSQIVTKQMFIYKTMGQMHNGCSKQFNTKSKENYTVNVKLLNGNNISTNTTHLAHNLVV